MLAFCLRWLIRLWTATLRLRRVGPAFERPSIVAFLHGDQLPLFRVRPAPPVVAPVSLSRDGALQAAILAGLGIRSVRGSSSREGHRAARGLLRALAGDEIVVLAVDGPRGPRGVAKAGAGFLAARSGAPIHPVGVAVGGGRRLRRAWDRYLLPLPFTRAVVWVGEALRPHSAESPQAFAERLGAAIAECNRRARRELRGAATRAGREDGVG